MQSKSLLRFVAVLALVAIASPVFAAPVIRVITVGSPAKFGKAEIEAGRYRLVVDGDKAKLMDGNKLVGEMQAKWEKRAVKEENNSYVINRYGQIEEVRFAGDNRVLVLANQ
jgi:hypothetical protein